MLWFLYILCYLFLQNKAELLQYFINYNFIIKKNVQLLDMKLYKKVYTIHITAVLYYFK